MPCPACGFDGHVTANGFAEPRRMVSHHQNAAVVCREYVCHTCEARGDPHVFRGWDPDSIKHLPRFIQETIPFICTRKTCISLDLLHDLNRWIMGNGTYNGFRDGLVEEHAKQFVHKMSIYYMYHSWAHSHGVLTSPRELPKFWQDQNDPNGYADYVPSAHTLQKFHLEWLERRDEFETAVQQSVGGTILAADMSHKITKLIFVNGNVKAFYGLLTVMNEHGQVVGWWLAKTGAHNELREAMQSLDQRYRLHGFVLPALFYTDKAIADKHFLTDVFPSLQDDDVHPGPAAEQELVEGGHRAQTVNALSRLILPHDRLPTIIYSEDSAALDECIQQIRALLADLHSNVIGLDLEWDFPRAGGTREPIALIQVATQDGHTWLFHVAKWNLQELDAQELDGHGRSRRKRKLPQSLKELLEDRTIIKAGSNIRNDRTLLNQDFNVNLADHQEFVDLAAHAIQHGVISHRMNLHDLVNVVLKRAISKDNRVRRSVWSSRNGLSNEQVQYAALDAYASVLVYAVVEATGDPVHRPAPRKQELVGGQRVYLYTHDRSTKLATGTVVVDPNRFKEGTMFGNSKTQITSTRVVVNVTELHNQQAYLPHGDFFTDARMTLSEVMYLAEHMHHAEPLVIWDVRDLRQANDTIHHVVPEIPADPTIVEPLRAPEVVERPPLLSDEAIDAVEEDLNFVDVDEELEAAEPLRQQDFADDHAYDQQIQDLLAKPCSKVKGDIFHVLHGLAKTLKQSHGAFSTFMKRLRYALTVMIATYVCSA